MTYSLEQLESVRQVFEPRYGKALTDDEAITIADSLIGFVGILLKVKAKSGYKN